MKLTIEQLNILNHIVPDGQAWADNAEKEIGSDAVHAKIARYRKDYEDAKAKGEYKNRAQRDAAAAAEKASRI